MKKILLKLLKKLNLDKEIIYYYNRVSFLWKSDIKYYQLAYKKLFDKDLNLKNPKTFNEKVIRRILFDHKNIYTQLADKYLVREYVKNKIGEKYLIELYGVYNNVKEINFNKLPNTFVLKCNHDSGSVCICENKKDFNILKAQKKLKRALRKNFYYQTREWHYKNIVPKIICEEKLEDTTDYKFHCFSGKVEHIEVIIGRFRDKRINVYDREWNLKNIEISDCKNTDYKLKKPKNFKKMIEIAERLSEDFDYVRVDLYNNMGDIKFGEITFTPAMGLDNIPIELDLYLGNLWKNK